MKALLKFQLDEILQRFLFEYTRHRFNLQKMMCERFDNLELRIETRRNCMIFHRYKLELGDIHWTQIQTQRWTHDKTSSSPKIQRLGRYIVIEANWKTQLCQQVLLELFCLCDIHTDILNEHSISFIDIWKNSYLKMLFETLQSVWTTSIEWKQNSEYHKKKAHVMCAFSYDSQYFDLNLFTYVETSEDVRSFFSIIKRLIVQYVGSELLQTCLHHM